MCIDWTFHHLGYATKSSVELIKFLSNLGYSIGELTHDPLQNVDIRLCVCSNQPNIEIIESSDENSPVTQMISKHGSIIYHICYEVESISKALQDMDEAGIRYLLISDAKPAILFENRVVCFYKTMFGVIELLVRTHL